MDKPELKLLDKDAEAAAEIPPAPAPEPKTVVFCLPGSNFSGRFLECWTNLFMWCAANNIRPVLSRRESCNIYYVRNMCLGGNVLAGAGQLPFGGQLPYDYIMWIDSDCLFNPSQFERLLSHDVPIIAAPYRMTNGDYAVVEEWDERYFAKHGNFKFMTDQDLKTNPKNKGLWKVSYVGMGFMLVKRGVFEAIGYPWFNQLEKTIGGLRDYTMEDVAFCLRAAERGFDTLIDPQVVVGHEKRVVL